MKPTRRDFIKATITSALGAAFSAPVITHAAPPRLEKLDLFQANTGGYTLYRIPGMVVTKKGTLLAYCEARKSASGDWGAIDILLRRSADGGQTWSNPHRLADVEGPKSKNPVALAQNLAGTHDVTYNNPVAIADERTGAVHFLFCLEYARCFYLRSDDDGLTFSKPVEITSTFARFKREYDWKVMATGPGHGIQLRNGRLIVPVWFSTGTGGHAHRPSWVSVIYSDDQGKTWPRGEFVARHPDPLINPSETVIVQLADGRVMLNIRSEAKAHRRAVSISRDGATGWSTPAFDEQLLEPVCMASLARLTVRPTHDRNRIVFANPHNLARADGKDTLGLSRDRRNLTIKLSYDEGQSWPISKTLEPDKSGYSDLSVGRDGTIYCFYENTSIDDTNYRTGRLTLARFNLEWLTDGKDSLRKSNGEAGNSRRPMKRRLRFQRSEEV